MLGQAQLQAIMETWLRTNSLYGLMVTFVNKKIPLFWKQNLSCAEIMNQNAISNCSTQSI